VFSKAYSLVKSFTRPVMVTARLADGTVESGCATFVVVNPEGWIVTAAHVLNALQASAQHLQERAAYDAAVSAAKTDPTLGVKQRNRKLEQIKPNPKWITNQSYWWSQDGVGAKEFYVNNHADIAVTKLDGLDVSGITSFPVFQ
jgi:hypothetical protein